MARREIRSPGLPAPMRPGAHSSGVEAPEGRTIYVSGHVSMDDEGNLVEVSALIDPRLLIEIEAVAVIE